MFFLLQLILFFISYAYCFNFLASNFNFLTNSAEPVATNIKQTPSKGKSSKLSTTNIINKESLKNDNSGCVLNDVNKLNDSFDSLRSSENISTLNVSTNNENHNVLTKGILIIKSPENGKQIVESNKSSDNLLGSEGKIKNPPSNKIFKKRVLLQNVTEKSDYTENNLTVSKNLDFQQQKASNSSQVSDLNQSFSKSPSNRNIEPVLSNFNRLFSPGNDSFVNLSKEQCSSLNASLLSQSYTQYECSSNSSQISENSTKSELHFLHSPLLHNETKNPVSPLYSQSMMLTPKNTYKSQNKSTEKQLRTNNYFKHSTPEQITNSSQKGVKSSSRQNISLADFITVDTRSSKKSSGKKNNQKTQLSRHSKEDEIPVSTSVLSEENFPEVGQSFERRRRIKPTKLDISSNKGISLHKYCY